MEQFNLEEWLKDKSRKICTRDGRIVEILKVDAKGNHPIIGIYQFSDTEDMESSWRIDGRKTENRESFLDLFFADEEEELTELQKTLEEDCDCYVKLYYQGKTREELREWIKGWCPHIIDLARKELEKSNTYSGNQKQEWSEEDENFYNWCLSGIQTRYNDGFLTKSEYKKVSLWLKSLKDSVQPKQEWSEEDREMLDNCLGLIQEIDSTQEEQNWLRSLKYQNRWKPSKEQIEAFEHFVRSIGESGYASPYDNNTKLIHSLLNDLKKL